MAKAGIIGGGAAGMFAAVQAAVRGHEVHLYEQNDKLGKKHSRALRWKRAVQFYECLFCGGVSAEYCEQREIHVQLRLWIYQRRYYGVFPEPSCSGQGGERKQGVSCHRPFVRHYQRSGTGHERGRGKDSSRDESTSCALQGQCRGGGRSGKRGPACPWMR